MHLRFLAERSSAGTAGAGLSVETGRWVKVTESVADKAAPAVVQPRLVRLGWFVVCGHGSLESNDTKNC